MSSSKCAKSLSRVGRSPVRYSPATARSLLETCLGDREKRRRSLLHDASSTASPVGADRAGAPSSPLILYKRQPPDLLPRFGVDLEGDVGTRLERPTGFALSCTSPPAPPRALAVGRVHERQNPGAHSFGERQGVTDGVRPFLHGVQPCWTECRKGRAPEPCIAPR